MHHQQQPVPAGIPGPAIHPGEQHRPHQRRPRQLQTRLHLPRNGQQPILALGHRQRRQIMHRQRHRLRHPDQLSPPTLPVVDVAGPQPVMMFQQPQQDPLPLHRRHPRRHLQQQRLVEMLQPDELLREEPPLDRRQLHQTGHRPLLGPHTHRIPPHHDGTQLSDRLVLEQLLDREMQTKLLRPENHLQTQNRIATEGEEVVVDTHRLTHPEHGLPDLRQLLLDPTPRRHILRPHHSGILLPRQRRQRPPIELAIRIQRQPRHRHEHTRHHVNRQPISQKTLQPLDRQPLAGGQPRLPSGHRTRDDVGHQPLTARLLVQQHRSTPHLGMLPQRGLDLTQLDPEPPDLDLRIDAADELDVAVGEDAGTVAGPVQPLAAALAERVGNEQLGRELGTVQIPARQPATADVQLPGHPDRHRLQPRVQHVQPRTMEPVPDVHPLQIRPEPGAAGGDRGLGGAVGVEEGAIGGPDLDQVERARLATDADPAQRGQVGRRQGGQRGRGEADVLDRLLGQEVGEIGTDHPQVRRRQDEGTARQQGRGDLPDRDVEAERGALQDPAGCVEIVVFVLPLGQEADTPMGDLNPLRLPRGTRRIDHIRQVVRTDPHHRSLRRTASQLRPQRLDIQHRRPTIGQQPDQRPPGQHRPQPRISNHVRQTLPRIGGIKRNIGTTSLQHRQQPDHHLHRPRNTHPDQRLRTHTPRPQQMSKPIRQPIKRRITHLNIPGDQRHPIRKPPGLLPEQLVETHRPQCVLGAGAVPRFEDQRALDCRDHRQLLDGLPRLRHRRFQKHLEVVGHASDRAFLEEIRAVFEAQTQPFGVLLNHDREVEARHAQAHAFFDQSVHPRRRSHGIRDVLQQRKALVRDHHLEDRVVAQIACRPQGLDDPVEGDLLVALGVEQLLADLEQHVREAGVAAQIDAERHRVDQETDHGLQLGAMAVGDRHADDDHVLPAVPGQEHGGAGKQGDVVRHLQFAADALDLPGQSGGQLSSQERPLVVLHLRAGMVGGQGEQLRGLGQLLLPVGQMELDPLVTEPVLLPHRVVGVLDRRRGRWIRHVVGERPAQLQELPPEQADRIAVEHRVVGAERQHLLRVRELDEHDAQQGTRDEVERFRPPRTDHFLCPRLAVLDVERGEIDHRDLDAPVVGDDLPDLSVRFVEGRPQALVAADRLVQARFEYVRRERRRPGDQPVDGVEVAARMQAVEEPEPLLVEARGRWRVAGDGNQRW